MVGPILNSGCITGTIPTVDIDLPITENQMEQQMEDEMESVLIWGFVVLGTGNTMQPYYSCSCSYFYCCCSSVMVQGPRLDADLATVLVLLLLYSS